MRVFKTSDMEEARQFFQEHLGKIALFTYEEGEYVIVIKDDKEQEVSE